MTRNHLTRQRLARSLIASTSVLAFASFAAGAALAADLGASCCADLEDRIAELEATTARKGNRKLSLRISGQVSQAVLFFDDGREQNIYQVSNSNSNSSDRFRLDGSTTIGPGLTAGYYLEFSTNVASSVAVSQTVDDSGNGGVSLRQSLWYLDSKRWGAISVGFGAPATDDLLNYSLAGTGIAASADTSLVGTNLFTRDSATGDLNALASGNTISLRWNRFVPQLDTRRANIVRYDSPVLAGFAVSAAWGEDDIFDIALRYGRRWNGLRVAFGAGYFENHEEAGDVFGWPRGSDAAATGNTEIREYKGSASVLHEPTGLFLSGAYLHREFSGGNLGTQTFACFSSGDAQQLRATTGIGCSSRPDFDYYHLSAGIKIDPFRLGYTSFYGEYARSEDAINGLNVSAGSAVGGDIDYVTSSTMQIWGVGVVQHISAAQMYLFLSYRNLSADVKGFESNGTRITAPLEDADVVMAGSRIRF